MIWVSRAQSCGSEKTKMESIFRGPEGSGLAMEA